MSQLKGKIVFITGGASGIGRSVSDLLITEGAKVFNFSRSSLLPPMNGRVVNFSGDIGKEEDVKNAFMLCKDQLGEVDILINNAGLGVPTPELSEASIEDYEQMVNTNMRGVFLCNREALKHMIPHGAGHIITVVSMAGQRTNPNAPLYCASKFGARGLSSGLADQVIKKGIKVTEVNPGPVDTAYWGDRQVPREKFLKPEDVAKVILFVMTQPDYLVIREINFDNMKFLIG